MLLFGRRNLYSSSTGGNLHVHLIRRRRRRRRLRMYITIQSDAFLHNIPYILYIRAVPISHTMKYIHLQCTGTYLPIWYRNAALYKLYHIILCNFIFVNDCTVRTHARADGHCSPTTKRMRRRKVDYIYKYYNVIHCVQAFMHYNRHMQHIYAVNYTRFNERVAKNLLLCIVYSFLSTYTPLHSMRA